MIDSVPAFAPTSPPETGASSIATSFDARRSANERVAIGSIVLMSIRRMAAAPPPPDAEQHELDVGRVGHHRDHDIGERGDSAGVDARAAPSATSASTGGADRECTVSG